MPSDINNVNIVGRLTRDCELKHVGVNNTPLVTFSIAVNKAVKKNDKFDTETSFFDVVYFGKWAEVIFVSLVKGKQVVVNGELRQNRWEQDGVTKSKVEILASLVVAPNTKNTKSETGEHGAAESGPEVEDDIPF